MSDEVQSVPKLGFFFMLFQSQLNGYVKCWTDGNENYDYYSYQEMLNILNKAQDPSIIGRIGFALETPSFYLWDVLEGTVTKVRLEQATSNIRKQLNDIYAGYGNEKPLNTDVITIPKI